MIGLNVIWIDKHKQRHKARVVEFYDNLYCGNLELIETGEKIIGARPSAVSLHIDHKLHEDWVDDHHRYTFVPVSKDWNVNAEFPKNFNKKLNPYAVADEDLEGMRSWDLEKEVKKLRAAIRYHKDTNRDDSRLYEVLPEGNKKALA